MAKPLVGFVGQGYIGKNYADDFEERGFGCVRYALEEPYRANKDKIKDCDIVFIAVPTPSTPDGFDFSIVEGAIELVSPGKVAVIKSTMVPGTTAKIQQKYPQHLVLFSPEFLSEATAAYDAAHPFANIVGMPEDTDAHRAAAEKVVSILPSAPFSQVCMSSEAEIVKYTHNASGYTQILLFNIMYDLARANGADWGAIHKAVLSDPMICNRYAQPVHKSGRGAGGHCFIKDFSALKGAYRDAVGDEMGIAMMSAMEEKNMQLLLSSGKDVDLLAGVYGRDTLDKVKRVATGDLTPTPALDVKLLICTQTVDKGDPILGFFHRWVAEFALHAKEVQAICLQRGEKSLPSNVREYTLGKETASGPRIVKRIRYVLKFWKYVWQLRHDYDTVLVHVNVEYVLLAGLFWRLTGKRVALLANDSKSAWKNWLAARIAHVVFHTDPKAKLADFSNAVLIPVGVEADFAREERHASPGSLLFIGRLAREKKLETIIEAAGRAAKSQKLTLDIYGASALQSDETYAAELRERFKKFVDAGVVSFKGPIVHEKTPPIYAAHDIFVHAGSVSGFNKALLEAAAGGCLVITYDTALKSVVHPSLFLDNVNEGTIEKAIVAALALSGEDRERERANLKSFVQREHALSTLAGEMLENLYPQSVR